MVGLIGRGSSGTLQRGTWTAGIFSDTICI